MAKGVQQRLQQMGRFCWRQIGEVMAMLLMLLVALVVVRRVRLLGADESGLAKIAVHVNDMASHTVHGCRSWMGAHTRALAGERTSGAVGR